MVKQGNGNAQLRVQFSVAAPYVYQPTLEWVFLCSKHKNTYNLLKYFLTFITINIGDKHEKYILALDQGTTSSRAILFDKNQNIVTSSQALFSQIYLHPGWVEHDPMEIRVTQNGVMHEVITKAGIKAEEIDSIGITNQRETTLIWDKETGLKHQHHQTSC